MVKINIVFVTNKIRLLSIVSFLPDGSECSFISAKDIVFLSRKLGISNIELEIIAMESGIIPKRYMRNMKVISLDDQVKILNSRVCIVGVGGLGGMVLENLARIGIGYFRLIDGDIFEENNLNRQLVSSYNDIGKSKVYTAMKRVAKINPSAVVVAIPEYLTGTNSNDLIKECEIIIDCLDNVETRFFLESESKIKKIPMISAAVAGNAGHIISIYPGNSGLKSIFGNRLNCKENNGVEVILGCLSYIVVIIASIESAEVIKIILGKKTLRNKLFVIDLENNIFEILKFGCNNEA